MIDNHLTDEALQAFLLKEISDHNIAMHLNECEECKKRMEEYQFLIADMQQIKMEPLPFDITSLVMEKIMEVESQKEKNSNILLYAIWSAAFIIIMAILYPFLKSIVVQLQSSSIIENGFILVSSLGVTVYLLSDLFRKFKQKEMLLLQQ